MASKFVGRDSDEEEYFSWYCDELKQAGILLHYTYQCKIYDMISGSYYTTYEQKKKSIKEHKYTLCQPKTYTPDFMLTWDMKHKSTRKFVKILTDLSEHNFCSEYNDRHNFFWCQNRPMSMSSHIDIKPAFSRRRSDFDVFSWKRTLLLEKYKINVQAVVLQDLFAKTFTPARYMRCDVTNKARKINFKTVKLEEFLKGVAI